MPDEDDEDDVSSEEVPRPSTRAAQTLRPSQADLLAHLDRARTAKWLYLAAGLVGGASLTAAWFAAS